MRLKSARAALKRAIQRAKNDWILDLCNTMNNTASARGGTASCWNAMKTLKAGLSKTRPSAEAKMKKADGQLASSAAENADVFKQHFSKLYGRKPSYDPAVLNLLEQLPEVQGLDGPPTDEEIRKAVSKLQATSPGVSGLPAPLWKALCETEKSFSLLRRFVLDFWERGIVPAEWNSGLLAILPKKGDLSDPGNYRGIMMLEVAYKVISILLHMRLTPIAEGLDHESQCGFRPARGCADGIFTVKLAMKKRREHGCQTWLYFLDLVKAFDRVPRELLWDAMLKLGVPSKLVELLKLLHVEVKVQFSVDGVNVTIESIIGVKQGDILGPILFIFFMAAVMISWRKVSNYDLCVYRSKPDFVMHGRSWRARGTEFAVGDSAYADDTAFAFCSRRDLVQQCPLINAHFGRWGMEVHAGKPNKASKSEILFVAAPEITYENPRTWDDVDLSDVKVDEEGGFIPIVSEFKYLGSYLARDCRDDTDVDARIRSAGAAFGALRKCLFSSSQVWAAAKRAVYVGLVLSILLYGSECWCLTEVLFNRLRSFHRRCVREMSRVSMKHSREHRLSDSELRSRLGLQTIDVYISRRQLGWAGHLARMPFERLPRKMLSSWVRADRPIGAPQFTYARGLLKALGKAGIDSKTWHQLAQDREGWREKINVLPF